MTEEKKRKCPPHYFIVDVDNVGRCKYCPEVQDFGEELRRSGVYVAAGKRGAKARRETRGKKGGRKETEEGYE